MEIQKARTRILLVVPFTRPDYAGSGINAFNFARFLIRNQYRVILLSFNRNLRRKRLEILDGVPIHRVAYFNWNLLTKALSALLIFPVYFFSVLRHRIIIIYGAHVVFYQILVILGNVFGRRVIFQSLLLGADDPERILLNRSGSVNKLIKKLFRRIRLYHAINPVLEAKYMQYLGESGQVLLSPQGYDPEQFHPASPEQRRHLRQELGIPVNCLFVLSVGFIIPRKGFRELFATLSNLEEDFRLVVVGEHRFGRNHFLSLHREYAERTLEFGKKMLGTKLMVQGPSECIQDYMQAADIFVLNSETEGLPNTLLEAMACGCAVLCKDLPGIRDYLIRHDQTGILYRDHEELLSQIRRLTGSAQLRERLGECAAESVNRQASFSVVWGKIKGSLTY